MVDRTLSFVSTVNEGCAEHAYDFGRDILLTYLWTGYLEVALDLISACTKSSSRRESDLNLQHRERLEA